MKLKIICKTLFFIGLACFFSFSAIAIENHELNTQKIEELTGLKGQLNEKEGVFKVSFPRNDLNVTAAGVKMISPMGLTSWAAFTK